jgi:polyisoprenoid-binding protein YceI
MKKFIILAIALSISVLVNAQLYTSTSSDVSFDSKTPMEDIYAQTKKAKAAVNLKTKKVLIKIKMISFKFEKPLMEEHFNEKYVETEKYPNASFVGLIQGDEDLTMNGTYNVKVKGALEIHGVKQERTLGGTVTVADGSIDLKTVFSVNLKDHEIKVPKVVVKNIAEVINIKGQFTCAPHTKK